MKKNAKKIKDSAIAIMLVIVLIVIIFLVVMYLGKLNTEKVVDVDFYQYFGGKKVEYTGSQQISKKGEITLISTKDSNIQLDSTPIYYKNEENKVLFPEAMLEITPLDNGKTTKINKFTNIIKEDESIYLEGKDEKKQVSNRFIYDGEDLYFFIEKTKIVIGDEEYEISPLSYVITTYKNGVEIYNYEKDEYKVIETEEDVVAQTDSYIINTSIDILKANGKEQLLLKNVDAL